VQEDAMQKARGQIAPRRTRPAGEAPEPSGPVGFEEWLKGMAPPEPPPAPARPRRRPGRAAP